MRKDKRSPVPRPRPEKSEEGLVTFPVSAESAVLILVHFQSPCQLLNSVSRGKPFTGEQRVKTDVVAVPRLAAEVRVGEIKAGRP